MRSLPLVSSLLLVAACGVADPADGVDDDGKSDSFDSSAAKTRETKVAAKFAAASASELKTLIGKMPKGGDLHMHLTGGATIDAMIKIGQGDNDCVSSTFMAKAGSMCTAATKPLSQATAGSSFFTAVMGAWSMQGFTTAALADRHTHFFDAFGKFGIIARVHTGDMLADVRRTAAASKVSYLEVMISLGSGTGSDLGEAYLTAGDAWTATKFAAAKKAILADPKIASMISKAKSDLNSWEKKEDTILGCGTSHAEPACDVTVRYLVQGKRIASRESVFGQFVGGFALAQAEPRVVGVNLVQAEDDSTAIKNYHDQMTAIAWVIDDAQSSGKPVQVSLHAGELNSSFATAANLKFHVREAVEAGASRIGHGVDILGEDDADGLMQEMAASHVAVEACLTSNQQLLGTEGTAHPAKTLIHKYVPVVFATDDEGILRTDMNGEIYRALSKQGLTYRDVKKTIRASMTYSFLPGTRLRDIAGCKSSLVAETLAAACQTALGKSERATAEWKLEQDLDAFEKSVAN